MKLNEKSICYISNGTGDNSAVIIERYQSYKHMRKELKQYQEKFILLLPDTGTNDQRTDDQLYGQKIMAPCVVY